MSFFVPFGKTPDRSQEPWRGHVRRLDDGIIECTMLVEQVKFSLQPDLPTTTSVMAYSTAGPLLLINQIGRRWTTRTAAASDATIRFDTAISKIDVATLASPRLHGIAARFPGMLSWAGLAKPDWTHQFDKQGKIKSSTISLPEYQEVGPARASGTLELTIQGDWRGIGTDIEQVAVGSALEIACRATRPREARHLIAVLYHVQTLLSIAALGYVPAEAGKVWPHHAGDPGMAWTRHVMARPPRVALGDLYTQFPFTLAEFGGLEALGRWVRLCEEHPRAVGPVEELLRGPVRLEPMLITAAVGIEYWASAHRRSKREWAKRRKDRPTDAHVLADRVGAAFKGWVGNYDAWAHDFWTTYNDLKHDPASQHDYEKLVDLAHSGRLLLVAALVDRASGKKTATQSMFANHQLSELGRSLQARYA